MLHGIIPIIAAAQIHLHGAWHCVSTCRDLDFMDLCAPYRADIRRHNRNFSGRQFDRQLGMLLVLGLAFLCFRFSLPARKPSAAKPPASRAAEVTPGGSCSTGPTASRWTPRGAPGWRTARWKRIRWKQTPARRRAAAFGACMAGRLTLRGRRF